MPDTDARQHFDRAAAVTRSLLGYGVLVGPFYLVIALVEAVVRDGFDLTRHSLSLLANGSWGWVHVALLVVSGLMVLAAALGFARAPGLGGDRRPAWALAVYGVCLVLSGLFTADPADGFPVGTPAGPPESTSTSGILHLAAGGIGFIAVAVAAALCARSFRRHLSPSAGRWSAVAAVVVTVAFLASLPVATTSLGVLLLWVSVLTIWGWLAWASVRLYRTVPHPDGSHRGLAG